MADYGGQVAQNLAEGKSLSDSLTQVDTNSILSSAAGGAVQGAVCGAVGGATFGVGLAACGVAGGALGGATSQFVNNALNGNDLSQGVLESAAIGGVVGGLSFGLANRFGGASLPRQLLIGTGIGAGTSGGFQIYGNLDDNDPCTTWNHNLGPALARGGASGFVGTGSHMLGRHVLIKSNTTTHATQRMQQRNISSMEINNTINYGQKINYNNGQGNVTGYRSSNGTFVAVGDGGEIITVINNTSSNYLHNLQQRYGN